MKNCTVILHLKQQTYIVLCEVYTKSLHKMYINFSFQGINYPTLKNYLTTELVEIVMTLWQSSLFYSIPPVIW